MQSRCFNQTTPLNSVITVVLAALLLALPTASHAADVCLEKCSFPPGEAQFDNFVELDANTGKILDGGTFFPRNTRVQLRFVHKNPFRFSYSYEVETQFIERDIIAEALQAFGLPSEVNEILAQSEDAEGPASPVVGPDAGDACAVLKTEFDEAKEERRQAYKAAIDLKRALRADLEDLKSDTESYNEFLKKIQGVPVNGMACQALCQASVDVAPQVDNLLKRKSFKSNLAELAALAGDVRSVRRRMERELKKKLGEMGQNTPEVQQLTQDCNDRLKQFNKQANDTIENIQAKLDPFQQSENGFLEKKKELVKIEKQIDAVNKNHSSFAEVRNLPAFREPVEHKVTIVRKDRTSQGAAMRIPIEKPIQAGNSRFSISAGIGLSFIEQKTFVRQPGSVPDAMGGTKTGDIFAIDENSSEQVGAMAQLNGHLASPKSWNGASFGWSLGVTVGTGDETSEVGYYTGPTFAFVDDQFFITLAYHLQKVSILAPSFAVGDPVPADLQGEIPLKKGSTSGLLVTFTYKIR